MTRAIREPALWERLRAGIRPPTTAERRRPPARRPLRAPARAAPPAPPARRTGLSHGHPGPTTPEYRDALRDLARGAGAAAAVGVFVNILHLSLPLYTIQVYDRVISSGSMDTLVALTGIVAVLLCFQAALDVLRHRIFTILGARMAAKLGRPVFEAAVETTLKDGPGAATGAMRDLGDLRTFVASGAIVLPLDIAMTPLFLVALMLMHPIYGIIGMIGAGVFVVLAILTELVARRPAARANLHSGAVHTETAAAIRNAEADRRHGHAPRRSRAAGTPPRPAPSPASRPAAPPPGRWPPSPRPSASACRSPSSAPAPPSS